MLAKVKPIVSRIEPDIMNSSKGALWVVVPIWSNPWTKHRDILKAGEHGSTFGGNYLSTRAGLEVLSILNGLYEMES